MMEYVIIFIIVFIMLLFLIWYICALMYIACELWKYDCNKYTKFGYWVCKIATLGTKE